MRKGVYGTSGSQEHDVLLQPPVPVHGTAGRYAAALYIAGAKAKKIDAIDKDLQQARRPPLP